MTEAKITLSHCKADFTTEKSIDVWIWGEGGKPILGGLTVDSWEHAQRSVNRWNKTCRPTDRVICCTNSPHFVAASEAADVKCIFFRE